MNFLHKMNIVVFIVLVALCITPWVSPPVALLMGIVFAQFFTHPYLSFNKKATKFLLQASVVGLGFGMNVTDALQTGKEGAVITAISIIATLLIGLVLGKIFRVEKITSFLISGGTAICGGSAIAALSPIVKANEKQISVALGTVFILNSVALFIFPAIGQWFNLSQPDFGLWCAIAIHDTSSVVGAAAKYGSRALEVATTVKLTRALWIIPLALFSALWFKSKDAKIEIPYFIGLFIVAIIINTYVPFMQPLGPGIVSVAKQGLTLTLFLIGSGLSKELLKSVGVKPIVQGVILWIIVSVVSLLAIIKLNL